MYAGVCIGIVLVSYVISYYMVKGPKFAVVATAFSLGFYVFVWATKITVLPTIFQELKSFAVFVPAAIYAVLNVCKRVRHHKKAVGIFLSIILFLNVAVTALKGYKAETINGNIYAIISLLLAISAFSVRWDFEGEVFGFNNKVWAASFGLCISYLHLFLFTSGSNFVTWLILMICYIPISRMGQKLFAYRAYSLVIYFNFIFSIHLLPFIQAPPKWLINFDTMMRSSLVNGVLLAASAISVALVYVSWVRMCRGAQID